MTVIGEYQNDWFEMSLETNTQCKVFLRVMTDLDRSSTTDRMKNVWQLVPGPLVDNLIRDIIAKMQKWTTQLLRLNACNTYVSQHSRFELKNSTFILNSDLENQVFITIEMGEK